MRVVWRSGLLCDETDFRRGSFLSTSYGPSASSAVKRDRDQSRDAAFRSGQLQTLRYAPSHHQTDVANDMANNCKLASQRDMRVAVLPTCVGMGRNEVS